MLLTLGIIQIVLGGLAGMFSLIGLLMALSVASQIRSGGHPMLAALPMLVYVIPAANLLVTGIGTVRFRRWSRLATIISSGIWLGILLLGLAGMLIAFATRPSGFGETTLGLMMVVPIMLIMLSLPVVLIVLYARRDVRETFERRNQV